MSPTTSNTRRPSSLRKVSASEHEGLKDYSDWYENMTDANSLYFTNLHVVNYSATIPTETDEIDA